MKKRFDWNELLDQIHLRNVIPIIGQKLYLFRTDTNEEVLLYQYLAENLAEELGFPPPLHINNSFSKMVFQYLAKSNNDSQGLKLFLTKNFASLSPVSCGPIWKLSRIKPFSLFINTTYDNLLEYVLNSVRHHPPEVLHHTNGDKQTNKITYEQIEKLENSYGSLIFHIYGSSARNLFPAYTETDILETLVTFQNDMLLEPENLFFKALRKKSLLFIGCGYDDWLFRLFIRAITNNPYQTSDKSIKRFIVDDFNSFNGGELASFFKSYNFEVFSSSDSKNFVNTLFDKMAEKYRYDIIHEVKSPAPDTNDTPETAFISFIGDNREAARQLASHLIADGITVWLDELKLKPGANIAETINASIKKCQVFIPLISEQARQFKQNQNGLRYHIKEWEWAHLHFSSIQSSDKIIPVKIDNTKWMYKTFENNYFVHIPGGNREKDYNKLKDHLLEIQNSNTR